MSYFHACVLGLIQGVSEFLPVSSSAHLALTPWLLGWPDPGLTFDVALHAGTLAAVLGYFWRDWLELLTQSAACPTGPQARLLGMLALGSVPAAVFGLAFEKAAEATLRGPALVAALLIGFGALMEAADRFGRRARCGSDLSWGGGLLIGCAQALAIAPGVSRSGVTMTAALALGLTRQDSARFSFLLATPIIAGASLLKLRHLHAVDLTGPFWMGVIVSAVSGWAAVGFLLKSLPSTGVRPYAAYRVLAGLAVLAVYFLR